jgi:hypothetical protein
VPALAPAVTCNDPATKVSPDASTSLRTVPVAVSKPLFVVLIVY